MGLFDLFKGPPKDRSGRCAQCRAEGEDMPFSKKFNGETHYFCSKECSRKFRIARKKAAKNPPTGGSSLPW
ncbi:MAG: hypothetical protein GF416_09440 [Candidatus Altiarchaeales archaeon]|nr:hypothetical protein [Candidatus Altiarchaeales archaeon]MBD3417342.1 hypothetical protein [Candidatus Altiarchaeales archaeon]